MTLMTVLLSFKYIYLFTTYCALCADSFVKVTTALFYPKICSFSYGDANETPLICWSDSISLFCMVSDYTRLSLKVHSVNGLFSCNVLCYF